MKTTGTRTQTSPSYKQPGLFQRKTEENVAAVPSSQACDVVAVGKRRDGGTRYWCIRHKADATAKYGKPAKACRDAQAQPIGPADTLELNLDQYKGGVALWGAVPAVYDTTRQTMDRGIHVHARLRADAPKEMDRTVRAVRIFGDQLQDEGIHISELDAIYYMVSSVFGFAMKYITCSSCGHPHLDKDWFSVHPHTRHLCAGCGRHFRDTDRAVGNPICGVLETYGLTAQKPRPSNERLKIAQADYPGGIQIWGSNRAFVWTGERAEAEGIHVHAYGEDGLDPALDETYSQVIIDGVKLDPAMVRIQMAQNILPSIKNRVVSIRCNSCGADQFSSGQLAFTPLPNHACAKCGRPCTNSGKLRNTIANPLPRILTELASRAPRPPQHHDLGLAPEKI